MESETFVNRLSIRWTFWTQRGGLVEAYDWLEQVLAQAQNEPPSAVYAAALYVAGFSARYSGEHFRQGHRYLEACLVMSRALGDQERVGLALATLGRHAFYRGDYAEARRLGQESLQFRRTLNIDWQTAMILANLGHRETKVGNLSAGRAYLEEALAYQKKTLSDYGMAVALTWLGEVACWTGHWDEAWALQMESRQLCKRAHLRSIEAYVCCEIAQLQISAGNYVDAQQHIADALTYYDTDGNKPGIANAPRVLIQSYVAQGEAGLVVKYAAFVTQLLNKLGMVLVPVDREQFDRTIEMEQSSLPPQATALAWAIDEAMTLEEAVAIT